MIEPYNEPRTVSIILLRIGYVCATLIKGQKQALHLYCYVLYLRFVDISRGAFSEFWVT